MALLVKHAGVSRNVALNAMSEKSNLSDQDLTEPGGLVRPGQVCSGFTVRHIRLCQVLVRLGQIPPSAE